MREFHTADYGPYCQQLLDDPPRYELGPGIPNAVARPGLVAMTDKCLFDGRPVRDLAMSLACQAGLWLRHNYLAESHSFSQHIDTPTGSFWHAIMHRREPDDSNSKYWYRRTGDHPVFDRIGKAARELTAHTRLDSFGQFAATGDWDPFAFVDWCAAVRDGRSRLRRTCREIGRAEWEILFDYSYRQALA